MESAPIKTVWNSVQPMDSDRDRIILGILNSDQRIKKPGNLCT